MKKQLFFITIYVFMFLLLSVGIKAEETGNNPVAVSPGNETAVVTVWQSCPTFSWSSVEHAASYRLAIFASPAGKIAAYENMASMASPVISKQITGPALSCTLSAEERLATGNMYAWYVQALDASGNAVGSWSGGKVFKVEQENRFAGIRKKLEEILKSHGFSDETAANVLDELKSEVQEVVVSGVGGKNAPGISRILGTEGIYNTFYGYNAGTAITSGISNAFVGVEAGYSNSSGSDNTFFGHNAGRANTASNNTFVGREAGYYNTTGQDNTFFGNYAGKNNTDGDNNTFFGFNAGYTNSTGNRNSFFGHSAGYSATGSSNTLAGYRSGYNTSGDQNVFFGSESGYTNTSGYNNVFLGYRAGHSNTTGHDNVFQGYHAGYGNTTGYYNTFIGRSAGYSNTTGNQNVFLGYNAGYNETGSNKLYIANSNTSSPLIYGEFDNSILTVHGKLGIGTNTPDYPMELETTGVDAVLVTTRTSGAQSVISATDSYAQLGAPSNHPVRILANNTWQMQVNTDGSLDMANGASCTSGGTWTNASSRALKENIEDLGIGEAMAALFQLNPVKYNYKVDKADKHVGFIAEDVPELVAAADRKGLSTMDVTAVLTKVVQELKKKNRKCKEIISKLQERVATLEKNNEM